MAARTCRESAGQDGDVAKDRLERLVEDVCAREVEVSLVIRALARGWRSHVLDILYSKFWAATLRRCVIQSRHFGALQRRDIHRVDPAHLDPTRQ